MTLNMPERGPAPDAVEASRRVLAKVQRDRREREAARRRLSKEVGDPSLGPGMWP